jgi:AbrB family looped-hinge helix DNA binding protein
MIIAAKMTSKGQITLPREVRRLLRVESGSVILFERQEGKIFIRPTKTLLDYRGYLKGRKKAVDFELMRERAKKYLAEKVAGGKREK